MDNYPEIDYEDMIETISKETGVMKAVVRIILEAEEEYLYKQGVVIYE